MSSASITNFHAIFYYQVLVPLREYRDENGTILNSPIELPTNSQVAWERVDRTGLHFERHKRLEDRGRVIIMKKDGDWVMVLRADNTGKKVTIYRKALRYLFKKEYMEAQRQITDLLSKFCEVIVEGGYDDEAVDLEDNFNYENALGIRNFFQPGSQGRANSGQGLYVDSSIITF